MAVYDLKTKTLRDVPIYSLKRGWRETQKLLRKQEVNKKSWYQIIVNLFV